MKKKRNARVQTQEPVFLCFNESSATYLVILSNLFSIHQFLYLWEYDCILMLGVMWVNIWKALERVSSVYWVLSTCYLTEHLWCIFLMTVKCKSTMQDHLPDFKVFNNKKQKRKWVPWQVLYLHCIDIRNSPSGIVR